MIKRSRQDSRISLFPKWRCCCSGFYLHPPLCGKCLVASTQSRQSWLICQNWGLLAPSYKSSTLLIQRKLHWWMMMVEIFCISLAHVLILINMKRQNEWKVYSSKVQSWESKSLQREWGTEQLLFSQKLSVNKTRYLRLKGCVCVINYFHTVFRGGICKVIIESSAKEGARVVEATLWWVICSNASPTFSPPA